MKSKALETGGVLAADDNSIVCRFPRPRLVLSTSAYNGGYLMADGVFNHRLSFFVANETELPGGSMENYLATVAVDLGFVPKGATGLLTSANMNCLGYGVAKYGELVTETFATAGVKGNAARAGDPACYAEYDGGYRPLGGTINIFAFTNMRLPRGTMAKTLMSITEAKTAVLQELAVASPFTANPATGTGTDGVVLVCNPLAATCYHDAGTQSKLGELFCRTVKTAVKQALAKECDIQPRRQGTVAERLRRQGLDLRGGPGEAPQAKVLLAMSQAIWQEYCWELLGPDELAHFFAILELPALQPLGAPLCAALRAKLAAASGQPINQPLGGVS